MKKIILTCSLVFFCLLTGGYLGAEWQTKSVQKGIDLNRYCQGEYGSSFKANLNGGTVGDWGCQGGKNERRSISIEDACEQQYGTRKIGFRDKNDPYSWYCEK